MSLPPSGAPGLPASVPVGPWLLVVGMHRSGTSALTGAIGALGFTAPAPDDRMDWPESNPEHWESTALTVLDDRILSALGGSWDAPPDPPADWRALSLPDPADDPGVTARRAYPGSGPVVWKDPRLCLLLPFWREVLPGPLASVLVWRSPSAVARSLRKRDGMQLADGIALWERYNRSALDHLSGTDTYVCSYEAVMEEPERELGAISRWLQERPQFAACRGPWDPARAAATISAGHRRTSDSAAGHRRTSDSAAGHQSAEGDDLLLEPQRDLMDRLTSLAGGHQPLAAVPLGDESGWTAALLAGRRQSRTREMDRLRSQLDVVYTSASWKVTGPLRSVSSAVQRLAAGRRPG